MEESLKKKKVNKVSRNYLLVLDGVKYNFHKGDEWKIVKENPDPKNKTITKDIYEMLKNSNVFK